MSSFWQTQDKIPISQKSVSVPSQNGLEYSGGQRIVIDIPSSVQYIQPRESYLKFDVKIKLPTASATFHPTPLQLDEILGGQSLLKDVRIYSGGAGKILLEEYQDYNVLTNVKYSYETNDVLRAKRALTEGSTYHSVKSRATLGTTESHKNSVVDNPYFKLPATDDILSDANFRVVKCLLPLHTGLFSSAKVLPVLLTEGLVIDIILEDTSRVMRMLDTARKDTRFKSKPIFHSVNGSVDPATPATSIPAQATPGDPTTGIPITEFFFTNDNSITARNKVPFCVGESVALCDFAGVDIPIAGTLIVATIEEPAGLPGNQLVKITFDQTVAVPPLSIGEVLPGTAFVFSNSVSGYAGVYNTASYVVSNVEMILQQLEMPQGYTSKMMSMMKEGGSMNYDFQSSTNFKYSQLKDDVVANIRLPLNMSRAKAILSVPTDATTYGADVRISGHSPTPGKGTYQTFSMVGSADRFESSDKSGLVGITDFITDYQYFYDGKLNPSRKVDCQKTASQVSISQIPLIELEKALVMSNITPFSFKEFQSNFVIGRALSLHNGIYDTRGKDFNLQVEYTGQTPAVAVKNKLWCNFISHIRRIVFKGNGISLEV